MKMSFNELQLFPFNSSSPLLSLSLSQSLFLNKQISVVFKGFNLLIASSSPSLPSLLYFLKPSSTVSDIMWHWGHWESCRRRTDTKQKKGKGNWGRGPFAGRKRSSQRPLCLVWTVRWVSALGMHERHWQRQMWHDRGPVENKSAGQCEERNKEKWTFHAPLHTLGPCDVTLVLSASSVTLNTNLAELCHEREKNSFNPFSTTEEFL